MRTMSDFVESLKELIGEKSIESFSAEVHISVPSLYKYLQGAIEPSLQHAIAIAEHCQCSLGYLFGASETTEHTFHTPPPFATAFRNILERKNCTRYRLHKDTGISYQTICDWYYGRRVPLIGKVFVLANYFDCTPDYLVGRE